MIIFLLGYMGSGKTKTGEILARKLGYDFLDTDRSIELSEEKSIAELFSSVGESAFRVLESKVLRSLEGRKDLVVATGGGLPCFFDNIEWMNRNGFTVYLKIPEGMLVERLRHSNSGRPLLFGLTENQLPSQVHNQLQEREIFYHQSALIFDAANLDMKSLIQKISQSQEI